MKTSLNSRPSGFWSARNSDMQSVRVGSAALGVAYPALHFFTALEDPGRAEPLWVYQLIGAMFLCVAAASFTEMDRRRFYALFYGALFVAMGWALWAQYQRGYVGTRVSLTVVAYGCGLLIQSRRLTALYMAMVLVGLSLGLVFSETPLEAAIRTLGRAVVGLSLLAAIAALRLWLREREAQHERTLRSLVQGSPVPTLLLVNDQCVLANDAAARLMGISVGESVRDMLVGAPPWWLTRSRRGRAGVQVRGPGGSELFCDVSFAPVEEEPDVLLVTLVDRTLERDQTRMKDELLVSISRELRPPLLAIKKALDGRREARGEGREGEGREGEGREGEGREGPRDGVTEEAARSIQYLEQLLDDMRMVHALRGTAAEDELSEHPAMEVCDRARALVAARAESLGVRVKVEGAPRGELSVRTDMLAAAHALGILLAMTVDAAAPGGEVTVHVEAQAPWVDFQIEGAALREEERSGAASGGEGGARGEGAEVGALPITIARSLVARVGGLLDAELPAGEQVFLSMRLPAG